MKKILLTFIALTLTFFVSCGKPDNPSSQPETPDKPQPEAPAKKSISVLTIGNSFSVDGMEYLYQILKEDGVEEIVLGNLYIGGCSLATHAGNFAGNNAAYTYYKNTTGTWTSTANVVKVDDTWWGKWNYRAFNLSYNPVQKLTEQTAGVLCAAFGVFVPKQ